jgi:hypothetical protein
MFAYFAFVPIQTTTHHQAAVTALLLVIALAMLASLAGILRRVIGRRGRDSFHAANGVCAHCGYSLRGLPSTICPECGSDTAVVGVRRPGRNSSTGRWILCGVWIALVFVFNSNFDWEIESYFLRLVWGFEYVHTGAFASDAQVRCAILFRQLLIAALMAGGVTVILFASRKSRWRAPADE